MNNILAIADSLSAMVNSLKTLGVWYYVILNAFGVIAILLKVTEFQFKKRSTILTFALLASTCWIFYFILYGDLVSAIVNFVCIVQGYVFLCREKYKWANSKLWFFFFLVVQITLGIIFFKVWHDIFPIIAGVFNVIAYFVMNKTQYRFFGLCCLIFWVLNSAFKFYPIALANDVFGSISAFVSIVRYDRGYYKNLLLKGKTNA
ncbi:MAG: YgjV family protein [Clostridia bacterium]|nr:YgjV family protein [Clostridia bacterium]